MLPTLAMLVSLACSAAVCGQAAQANDDLVVPVHYADHALVIVTPAGVACVQFTEAIENGTNYRFRFRPADGGEEQTGEGKVYEKYERVPATGPSTGPSTVQIIDRGSELNVVAGNISLQWSRRDSTSGWIYFSPELERVHLVAREGADQLDLSRFAR